MALSTRTLAEWRDRFRAVIRGLITNADTSRGSPYYADASILAQLAAAAQGQALYVLRQIFPATADGDSILQHAKEHDLSVRPASQARGLIRILGAGAVTQANGSAVTAADGTAYTTQALATTGTSGWALKTVGLGSSRRRLVVLADVSSMNADDCFTLALPSGATAHCTIRAVLAASSMIDLYEALDEDPAPGTSLVPVSGDVVEILADEAGAQGTKSPGETMTITAPDTGITATARLLECSGGADVETTEELAARITSRIANPPAAGNLAHIRDTATRTPNVRIGDAFVYPGVRGLGTIDVVVWGLPGARQASTPEVDAVQEHLDENLSFLDDVLCIAATHSADAPVSIEIETHEGYGPDWTGSFVVDNTPNPSTTTSVEFSTSIGDGIELGDRILIPVQVGGRWRTFERTVESKGVSSVSFPSDPLPFAPADGSIVVSGGPASSAIIAAIEAYFDALGPGTELLVGSTIEATYHRVPSPSETAPGVARKNGIQSAVEAVPGVKVANVDPLDGALDDAHPNPLEMVQLGLITLSWL